MDIPVIMLTIIDERGRGLLLGATEYLIKPVDSEQLINLIRSCMKRERSNEMVLAQRRKAMSEITL
jgi:DNA-binding response OmpR family regulator